MNLSNSRQSYALPLECQRGKRLFSAFVRGASASHMAVVDRDEQPARSPIGRARHHYAVVVLAGADRIVGAVEELERHQIHIVAVGGVAFDVEKRIVKNKGDGGQTCPSRSVQAKKRSLPTFWKV